MMRSRPADPSNCRVLNSNQELRRSAISSVSAADIAAQGRPITFRQTTFDEDRQAMMRAGVPAPIATMNAQAFSLIASGDAEWLSDDVPLLLGRPARSFGRFVKDYASASS